MKAVWLAIIVLVAQMGLNPDAALAQDDKLGEIRIDHPWARATPPGAKTGVAFATFMNDGATDWLLAASADVSDVAELHTHVMDGDVMRMRQVESIELKGGTTTMLEPGGLHIMLIELKAPLVEGETFPLTLTFERAGKITVDVGVESAGAMGHGDMGHGGTGHGG